MKMKRSVIVVLALLCALFICPSAVQAAGLSKTSATTKAGTPVFLELKGASGKGITWSITNGQMIFRLSETEGDYSETRVWNGKTYNVYDSGQTGYPLRTPAGCGSKVAVVPVRDCKVIVKDVGTGKTYTCPITVTPQKVAKADVLAVNCVKIDGKHQLRLSHAFAYADGNRAAFNGTVKVTVKDAKSTVLFSKSFTIAQKSTEYGAFYYDNKGAVRVLNLNTPGSGIKTGSSSSGTVTIVAKEDGQAALKTVTSKITGLPYKKNATQITLAKTGKVTVGFRKKMYPKLVVKGETLTGFKWSSSNTTIATVSSSGIVTGKKVGTCNIVCTLANGKKYTCKMTVRENKYNTGKVISNCFVSDYNYGYVSLELSSIYVKDGKLYTKWVALNNRIYKAVKFQYADVVIKDGDGKTIANKRFSNVALNLGAKEKKYVTLVFPADKFTPIDFVLRDFTWRYEVYNIYS